MSIEGELNEFFDDLERRGLCRTIDLNEGVEEPATVHVRRELLADINTQPTAGEGVAKDTARRELEGKFGQVWDTDQLGQDYEVQGFAAPFVIVRRKADGQRGSLMFQHHPRFYWGFDPAN